MASASTVSRPIASARSVFSMNERSISPTRFPLKSSNGLLRSKSSLSVFPQVNSTKIYYNTARNQLYSRFTPSDWISSNNAHFKLSEGERAQATRMKSEAWKAVKETEQKTRSRQAEATKRLNERVQDISFWRQELDQEIRFMEIEQENLKEHLRLLRDHLEHTQKPLSISEHCLVEREGRQGIDQVQDDVEKSLMKEVESIKKCQDKMKRIFQKGEIQMKMNRAAQYECEKDLKDKSHSHKLDDKMYHLKNSSSGLAYYPGIELFDNTISIPKSWTKFSQDNIHRSQRCRAASEAMRGEIDMLMRHCANIMWSNFNNVNNSLMSRVQELTNARNKLQAHLQRTIQEIFDCDKSINLIKKAILDKEGPLKLTETRLEERTKRLNVELCNDPAMKTLQKEVVELRNSIRLLKEQKRNAEIVYNRLLNTKSLLEKDISVKENSLHIDQKACLGVRKIFPMDQNIGPILEMPLTF